MAKYGWYMVLGEDGEMLVQDTMGNSMRVGETCEDGMVVREVTGGMERASIRLEAQIREQASSLPDGDEKDFLLRMADILSIQVRDA